MTDKAYIVVNEQQECEVLEKLYIDGMTWCGGEEATQIIPSDCYFGAFPYVIFVGEWLSWNKVSTLEDEEIAFDGRKEEKMSEKYVVSQEFMNELKEWRCVEEFFVGTIEISTLPDVVKHWRCNGDNKENNNRLIAIIRWVNGEDVFEIEKPKLWIVRSKDTDTHNKHNYIFTNIRDGLPFAYFVEYVENATKFETKEEAESWVNARQEIVEVEG